MERFGNSTNEIAFDDLSATDEIFIRTENSEYRFSVIDPAQHSGVLSGGAWGDQRREAFLIGAVSEDGKSPKMTSEVLKTGARALFFLNTGKGVQRILTSVIQKLSRVPGQQSSPRHIRQTSQSPRPIGDAPALRQMERTGTHHQNSELTRFH
ncbi:MAG TPA: hypothetical protein VNO70_11770 [Blastocatellia bacterium]|nr:hypothetical protein [Blastocatellia bacterium]